MNCYQMCVLYPPLQSLGRLHMGHSTTSVEDLAHIFNNWYWDSGDIIPNCNKLFVSKFQKALYVLTGTKVKMSMTYHPETDCASEHTNKTVNQMLNFYVKQNQSGWVNALPLVHFNIMNTINKSMASPLSNFI